MSWGTCYSGSNNIHFDFPPIMSDGRNFACYLPACEVNNNLLKDKHISSNNDYRQYLISNADSIISKNQKEACDDCCTCGYNKTVIPEDKTRKYLYKSCSDSTAPYGYETSDLKNIYLSQMSLFERSSAPFLSQEQYLMRSASCRK